ncbi:MAG: endonuclease III, partial [Candidatus Wildermuthbacteria bacterium]|nr:endonuclease III [Candidatus Wildermuthbacteria bacterium]
MKAVSQDRKKRAKKILSVLKRLFPKAGIVLRYSNPWELLVSVMLSAQ